METAGHLEAGRSFLASGLWERARESFAASLSEVETAEALDGLASAEWWLCDARSSVEHRARAHELYRRAGAQVRAARTAVDLSIAWLVNLGNGAAAAGWLARAESALREAEASECGAEAGALRGWTVLMRGYMEPDGGRARALLETALARARSVKDIDLELVALSDLGVALVDAGEVEAGEAARVAGELEELARALGQPYPSALAAAAEGRLAVAAGRHDEAVARFDLALERIAELGLPLDAARIRLDLARVLAGSDPALAVSEATAALRGFDALGAAADADAAAALLRGLGVAGRAAPRQPGTLTKREEEVLRLLGMGLSNREIADRLFISRKTAGHHVSRVLAKLGLRNRAEAAAYAVRHPAGEVRRRPFR